MGRNQTKKKVVAKKPEVVEVDTEVTEDDNAIQRGGKYILRRLSEGIIFNAVTRIVQFFAYIAVVFEVGIINMMVVIPGIGLTLGNAVGLTYDTDKLDMILFWGVPYVFTALAVFIFECVILYLLGRKCNKVMNKVRNKRAEKSKEE